MKTILTTLIGVLMLPALMDAQPVADHLTCYKVEDPQAKTARE